jgi:hypothetical protein
LAKLAAWTLSLMYMGLKLAAWALKLEVRAIDEVTSAIGCENREESSRRRSPHGTCWAGPCSLFLTYIEIYIEGYTKLWAPS